MAEFESTIHAVTVSPHPNADRLDIAQVADYMCVIGKDSMKTGDLAAYIPEGALVPDDILEELNLTGRLAGKKRNRVKAIKLRGVLSQGIVYPVTGERLKGIPDTIGLDVTGNLGLVKYVPEIPTHMNGEIVPASGLTIRYDIENVKRHPDVFEDGEPVVITEKLHGTWAMFGWRKVAGMLVSSKGLSSKGFVFDLHSEKNDSNLYVRQFRRVKDDMAALHRHLTRWCPEAEFGIYILGEIVGRGVQDLTYGKAEPEFLVFDIYVGSPGTGRYLDTHTVQAAIYGTHMTRIDHVPILHEGPYDRAEVARHLDGMSTLDPKGTIREGVVIRPIRERRDPTIGRVILKSVSEKYLLRKGGTEHN